MQNITLNLTVEEANLILEALGQLPFSQVYQLIGKIQAEASEQLQDSSPQQNTLNQPTNVKNLEINGHDQ